MTLNLNFATYRRLASTGGSLGEVSANCHLPTLSANFKDQLEFNIHAPSDFCLSFTPVGGEKLLPGQIFIRESNYVSNAAKSF